LIIYGIVEPERVRKRRERQRREKKRRERKSLFKILSFHLNEFVTDSASFD
jgi:hypothetical protein